MALLWFRIRRSSCRRSGGEKRRRSQRATKPIGKKPLARCYPGSVILSVGSFGCNLRGPFCQNWEISMSDCREYLREPSRYTVSPERLAALADELRARGNIGVAFTYNEPLVCDYLGYTDISTHSFRKWYATEVYKNNDYDSALVQRLLQHSSAAITQRYIGIEPQRIEKAIESHAQLL